MKRFFSQLGNVLTGIAILFWMAVLALGLLNLMHYAFCGN